MAEKTNTGAVAAPFDWDAVLASDDAQAQVDAAIAAELAAHEAWRASEPTSPVTAEYAYLAAIDAPRRQALAAQALGITVEALQALLKSAEPKPAKSGRKSSTRSGKSPWDPDVAQEFIDDMDGAGKYDVIRAMRETHSVNIDEFTELWDAAR